MKRRGLAKALWLLILFVIVPAALSEGVPAKPMPADFELRTIDGRTVSSKDLLGKVVVLAFGASWLPLSRKQLGSLEKLAGDYGDKGVVVYWVSTDSESPKSKNYASDEQLLAFSRKYGPKVPVLRDPDARVSRRLGINELPAVVILDQHGNVSGAPYGGLDPGGDLAGQLSPSLNKVLHR